MKARKKRLAHKNVIDGRKPFIRRTQRTGKNDLNEHRVNDSGHNEGTICLLKEWMGAKGMVFRVWTHELVPFNLQWLVLRVGGADFLHCWVCQEKNCPPKNFYPRIKIFNGCVKIFCPTLKIFVRLVRPCLTAFSSAFSVLLAACKCFFLLL